MGLNPLVEGWQLQVSVGVESVAALSWVSVMWRTSTLSFMTTSWRMFILLQRQPLSKALFPWRVVGMSPLVLITYPVRVVSSRAHKGGGGVKHPYFSQIITHFNK